MVVRLEHMPPIVPAMLDGLLRPRRRGLAEDGALPATTLLVEDARIDAQRLDAYRDICGFPGGGMVPVTYPFVFAFPLQLALLTRPDWPLRPAGLIHMGVVLRQHRPLDPAEPLRVSCTAANGESTQRGLEFELSLAVHDAGGKLAWEGSSLVLSRAARPRVRGSTGAAENAKDDAPAIQPFGTIVAAADTGREYARVAADWNPIHLGWLGARLLGMRGPIAHGMWTLARVLAVIGVDDGAGGIAIDARFRAPLTLPGTCSVQASPAGEPARAFEGRDATSGRLLLSGMVTNPVS